MPSKAPTSHDIVAFGRLWKHRSALLAIPAFNDVVASGEAPSTRDSILRVLNYEDLRMQDDGGDHDLIQMMDQLKMARQTACIKFVHESIEGQQTSSIRPSNIRLATANYDGSLGRTFFNKDLTTQVRQLRFEVVWSWRESRLMTPLRQLAGLAANFPNVMSIRIIVIVSLAGVPRRKVPNFFFLASYAFEPKGYMNIIAAEVTSIFAGAIMDHKLGRDVALPYHCLDPATCSNRIAMNALPCRAKAGPSKKHTVRNLRKPLRVHLDLRPRFDFGL